MPARDPTSGRFISGGGSGGTELDRLVVRLTGDGSGFIRMLRNAEAATARAAKRISAMGSKISGLGRSLSLKLTAPLSILGVAAIKVGADFQRGFIGVRKTVDATEKELAVLRQGFKDLSLEVPVAVEELLQIGQSAGQLGIANKNILSFTKTIAAMGVATNLTTEEAATSMARFANIVGMSQGEFSNLGSSIVALGNSLATTEQEIVGMSMRLAGAGTTIGLTESQIVAFAASLSSVGLQAEAGGTSFSKLFLNMQTALALGGKELGAFAEVAGVTTEKFAQGFREDAAGSVRDLLRAIGKLDSEAKVLALKKLGLADSVRMTDSILRMSGAVDLLDRSLSLSEKSFKENTALSKEAAEAYKGFWSQLTLLKNQVKSFLDDVFILMEPTLLKVTEGVKSLVAGLSSLSPQVKRTALVVAVVVAAIGPLLLGLGGLLSLTGFAITGLGSLIGILTAILSPVVILTAGVVALGAAVVHWSGVGGQMVGWFAKQWQKLIEFVQPAIDGIKNALSAGEIALAFEIMWVQIQLTFATGIKPLLETWAGFTAAFKTSWADAVAFVRNLWNDATTGLALAWEALKAEITGDTSGLAQRVGAIVAKGNIGSQAIERERVRAVKRAARGFVGARGNLGLTLKALEARRDKLAAEAARKLANIGGRANVEPPKIPIVPDFQAPKGAKAVTIPAKFEVVTATAARSAQALSEIAEFRQGRRGQAGIGSAAKETKDGFTTANEHLAALVAQGETKADLAFFEPASFQGKA